MKIFLALVILFVIPSCGVYKYDFHEKKSLIVSVKRNNILQIRIKSEDGQTIARFEPIANKKSVEFSLKTLSPECFECVLGCPFVFVKEKIYLIDISPAGDRMLSPIKIQIKSDGTFLLVKREN